MFPFALTTTDISGVGGAPNMNAPSLYDPGLTERVVVPLNVVCPNVLNIPTVEFANTFAFPIGKSSVSRTRTGIVFDAAVSVNKTVPSFAIPLDSVTVGAATTTSTGNEVI
jgi:hypothetical protein